MEQVVNFCLGECLTPRINTCAPDRVPRTEMAWIKYDLFLQLVINKQWRKSHRVSKKGQGFRNP